MIPFLIFLALEAAAVMSIDQKEFPLSIFIAPITGFNFMIISIAPNQVKGNWAGFFFGWLYFILRLYFDRNFIDISFIWSFVTSNLYFFLSSYMLNLNMTHLYKQSEKNRDQANEFQRLLEVFPHGVIIHSADEDNGYKVGFTNKEFNEQIRNIRNRISELEKIEVIDDKKECKMNLHEFLLSKEMNLHWNKVIEQKKLTVRCHPYKEHRRQLFESDENGDQKVEKVFTVKSIKVDWRGKMSFMHVFLVNNDIVKLEEANNNIRLQKIMFASVSHEFRTPLNAIINSFNLASNLFDEFMPIVNQLLKFSKNR
jgi:hypothetical protein